VCVAFWLCFILAGKDRTEKKLLGFSYLRLSADDSTTVYDGLHELQLHKVSFVVVIPVTYILVRAVLITDLTPRRGGGVVTINCQLHNTRYRGVELGQVSCGKQTLGVEFNVIKVVCINSFCTISIRIKV